MQRIAKLDNNNASEETVALLDAVKKQLGLVPALVQTMAQSPATLKTYLAMMDTLSKGVLTSKLGEQISIAVGGANGCNYCASAHTAIARKLGLSNEELEQNLLGKSSDPKTNAALHFVRKIVATRAKLTNQDLSDIRAAGFSEEEIIELLAHTVLNIFTNYFNHIADTEVDFPLVETAHAETV